MDMANPEEYAVYIVGGNSRNRYMHTARGAEHWNSASPQNIHCCTWALDFLPLGWPVKHNLLKSWMTARWLRRTSQRQMERQTFLQIKTSRSSQSLFYIRLIRTPLWTRHPDGWAYQATAFSERNIKDSKAQFGAAGKWDERKMCPASEPCNVHNLYLARANIQSTQVRNPEISIHRS